MAKKQEEEHIKEEHINTEEIKENVFKQGKWLRLLYVLLFLFIYTWAYLVLWLVAILQFLFNLLTNSPNLNLSKLGAGFRVYMVQIINFVTYQEQEKPFPFSDFPSIKD